MSTKKETKKSPKKLQKQSETEASKELQKEHDNAVMDILHKKGEDYYIGLVSRYLKNPASLYPEELRDLQESPFISQVSEGLDSLKVKRVSEKEAAELKQAEVTLQNYFNQIGQIEFHKNLVLRSALILEEQKTEFLNEIGRKYQVKGPFSVDVNTGEIKMMEK